MCWKELNILDERCPFVKVYDGTNAAQVFNGIYIANKYNDKQYFKLGTQGFFTLSKYLDGDGKKESWGFKKAFNNYEFFADNSTDYSLSANPYIDGYGENLKTSCITLAEIDTPATVTFTPFPYQKLSTEPEVRAPAIKQKEYIKDPMAPLGEEDTIFFAPNIDAPKITSTSIKNTLYEDNVEEIKITWGEVQDVDEYRLEIYREERGKYNSKAYFTKDNEFIYKPEGGNYFFKVNGVRHTDEGNAYGYDSETYKFTKLYPGNCPEKDITIHFDHYEDKHVYVKVDNVWYGTGDKYGEPVSMVTFPCPITIDEFDYENNPNHMVVFLGRDRSRILKSINLQTSQDESRIKDEIEKLYSKQLINQSTVISSRHIFP